MGIVNEEELLAARLAEEDNGTVVNQHNIRHDPSMPRSRRQDDQEMSQWAVKPNGMRRPASSTRPKLEAALYTIDRDDYGIFFQKRDLVTDECMELPDAATQRVLEGIRKFWRSRERYGAHGLVYKRGVLLWGPPGSGKTVTSQLLARELIAMDWRPWNSGQRQPRRKSPAAEWFRARVRSHSVSLSQ